MAVTKRKRVSKKSKSSWRKHVNISDVEEYLEEKLQEERLGAPLSSLSNDDIFKIETQPSSKVQLSKKEKRLICLKTSPKCFSALQPHTKVLDPIIKRNRVRTKEERKNNLIKIKEETAKRYGICKAKAVQSEKDKAKYEVNRKNKPKRGEFNEDLWSIEAIDKEFKNNSSEWITTQTKIHTLCGVGKVTKSYPNSLKQKQDYIPSVELPHPGISYNPSYEDHQTLLNEIVEKENKIIKEEKHLARVTRNMFKKVSVKEKDAAWITEMSQGLQNDNTSEKSNDSDNEYKTVNEPVKNVKKTLKQRRKQKEQLEMKAARRMAKMEKKKVADIYKLKFLHKEIDKSNEKIKKLQEKREKLKETKKKETKRLSSIKFEEPDVVFNMGEDLPGNLRNVKKEGNLLNDRFKSLQKRNILEATTIKKRPKPVKVKRFVKPGFKDDWKTTVAR